MREDKAYAMDQAIERGDTAELLGLLRSDPRLTGTAIPVKREWGEEVWLPLHRAASLGRLVEAKLLLDAQASVDARTRFRTPMHARQTPLMLASASSDEDVVVLLLEHGADAELIDANDLSPLSHAAGAGHVGIVRRLIDQGVPLDPVDEQQRTPLHRAIAGGHVDTALVLIDAGADVNHACPKEPAGYTPLHRCASYGVVMQPVIDRLLTAGGDVERRDPRFGRAYHECMAEA